MTELKTPVARRTVGVHSRHGRKVIATLHPGDVLQLRLERGRNTLTLDLMRLYDQAELAHAKAISGFSAEACANPMRARNV